MHRNLRPHSVRPVVFIYSYLVSGGGFHICGGRVSLSLAPKGGCVNLDVVSVPSTPQSEVLNPRFSEYPLW